MANYVTVRVYHTDWDCTAGGITSIENREKFRNHYYLFSACLSMLDITEIIIEQNIPMDQCLQVEERTIGGKIYKSAVPINLLSSGVWHMFGGNYLMTSDSRYKEVTGMSYPLPVHDRVENF